jgi:hypothetical protein
MRATITATADETRILVEDASGDRLLARLPSLPCAAHPRALPCLVEALALWSGTKVHVVLYADERFSWENSGLSDALSFGIDTLFFEVEVVPLEPRRRRTAKRLTGLGSFARERSAPRRTG